ncbi:MAG: hypothetical protein ACR2MO_04855 [Acidimicrobiales bacterium]
MQRLASLLLVVAAATAACKSGGDATADPTVPIAVSTSTANTSSTTSVADIATIPDVIDAPYMNRVLAALDKVDTSAVRVIVETKDVPQRVAELYNSIYNDEWFTLKIDSWISALEEDRELSTIRRPVGDRVTTVDRLIATSPGCVWMAVKRDYSQTDVAPGEPRTEYLALQPLDPSNDPNHHNPTAWMITTDGTNNEGREPANPCPVS